MARTRRAISVSCQNRYVGSVQPWRRGLSQWQLHLSTCWSQSATARNSRFTAPGSAATTCPFWSWLLRRNNRCPRVCDALSTNTRSQPNLSQRGRPSLLALTRHEGRTILVLDDPGGEPLDRVLDRDVLGQSEEQPLDLARFLRLAISLATALGHVHQRGLIHKDVKPENVLVDDAGHVWLTGFGIASRLPRERQSPAAPETVAGTLAYMSPEQTGRMNRSIDTRSDLYSLGVTLYQMLTGVLPFAAADPLEWVHCHIARQPVAPADRRAVPEPLSAITMRLLAKNAEERYQTAAGLEADLRRCLSEWQSHGRIDPFPLGADDLSDRLLIPEKLYGREREVETLLAAFDRVVAGGRPELVLVSGYSGVGKSAVVNELHKSLVPPRGLFASGKFDQYKRDIPYATVAQAFQSLIRPLLSKPEAELSKWRDDLRQALSPNGSLLVDLVPELKLIIGEQPPVAPLPPQEAKIRSHLAFRRFLGVFARPEHPLAPVSRRSAVAGRCDARFSGGFAGPGRSGAPAGGWRLSRQ